MTTMTSDSMPLVRFSQESLYFPSSFTDVTIENIVQIRNLLQRTQNRTENIVAFKVVCLVRNRYRVAPSTGFILPEASVRVKFFLDVQKAPRHDANKSNGVVLVDPPNAAANDEIFVHIAIVPHDQAKVYVDGLNGNHNSQDSGSNGNSDRCANMAAAFWRTRGLVRPGETGTERRRLRCVHGEESVPDTLLVRMSRRGVVSPAAVDTATPPNFGSRLFSLPPEVPTSRPQTAQTRPNRTSPPRFLPTIIKNRKLYSATNSLSPAASEKPPVSPAFFEGERSNGDGTTHPPAAAVYSVSGDVVKDRRPLWERCFYFKIPFPVVGMLLLMSFLCALLESGTFLSWLLIGK